MEINRALSRLHDGGAVHFLDIGKSFLDANGEIPKDVMPDLLHPGRKGYEIWADAIREPLRSLWPGIDAAAKQRKIEVGYCSPLKDLEAVKAAGFDYAELRTSEGAALTDEEFEALVLRLRQLDLRVPVTFLFIPREIRLTGPAVDEAQQIAYVKKAFDRVSRLGARTVVFGSGPARSFPEGFPREEALRQLVGFCKRIAPLARARGIVLAFEAQRRQEANLINNIAEGLELVAAVADPNFQLVVDFYHLAEQKEHLKLFIREARSRGATPVLVTSMPRRNFDADGRVLNTLGDYPEAVRQTAKEEAVALIDLFAASKAFYEALGPERSKKAFVH